MKSEKNLSIFIPFYNEEKNLARTVELAFRAAQNHLQDFEILLVDDGSTDQSNKIAQTIVNEKVKLIVLEKNSGFGIAYLQGYKSSQLDYAVYLCADGDVTEKELNELFDHWDGRSNLIQYCNNSKSRSPLRFYLSELYTKILCLTTGTKFPYFNGFNILSTKNKDALPLKDFGFSSQAYVLLHALKNDVETKQFGMFCKFNDSDSKSIKTKNIIKSLRFLFYVMGKY